MQSSSTKSGFVKSRRNLISSITSVHCFSSHFLHPKLHCVIVFSDIFPQMWAASILTSFNMFAQILLQEMKLSIMKAQSQLLEYIAWSLYSSANLSSKQFMHQDGDQILIRETFPHSIILDLLSLQCSSIARGRMDVEAGDTLNKIWITVSALREGILNVRRCKRSGTSRRDNRSWALKCSTHLKIALTLGGWI
jgi:hypothetical protein